MRSRNVSDNNDEEGRGCVLQEGRNPLALAYHIPVSGILL